MRKNQGIMKSFKGFLRGNKWNILPWTLGLDPRVTKTENDNSPRVTVIPPHNIKRGLGGAYTHPQHAQSGRSMTEMLGVLAVMAVLTIGGIVGYNYAMNKHRSNVILNDVKQLAVLGIAQDFLRRNDVAKPISPDDLGAEMTGSTPYIITKESDDSFFITGNKIPLQVCQILTQETPAFIEQIIPNPLKARVCTEGDNEIDFYVNADMNGILTPDRTDRCDDTHACDGCSKCVAGLCVDNDENCPSGQLCKYGICSKCDKGSFMIDNDVCQKCDSPDAFSFISSEECHSCSNRYFRPNDYNTCVPCAFDTITIGADTKSECGHCPNRIFMGENENAGTCILCKSTRVPSVPSTLEQCRQCNNRFFSNKMCKLCPARTTPNANGTGCTGCPAGQFWHTGGMNSDNLCSVCGGIGGTTAPNEECIKCDNMFPTTEYNGCYRCDVSGWADVRKTTLQFCNKCANRYYDTPSSACKLCPTGQSKNAEGTGCQ